MIVKIIFLAIVFFFDASVSMETQNCSIRCFFTTKSKELIKCQSKIFNDSLEYVNVECINGDDLTIGNLESVGSLAKDFLAEMPFVRYLTLNLQLVTLEPNVLSSEKLLELKLMDVKQLHRNSFINLPNLENINFGQIGPPQMPEFFILRYLERKQITTVNIGVECFKCEEDSKELLVFPSVPKIHDFNLYVLQSINVESCLIKSELTFCNNSGPQKPNSTDKHTYQFLKLSHHPNAKDSDLVPLNKLSLSIIYIGLIICFAVILLLLCLLILQSWTIYQLRKTTRILNGIQFYPTLADSEISDNNETNSYYGHNGILYQHNFPLSKA